ncbi:lonely Cys domain-containing protein [Streptomyces sp. NPDC088788]|uniref:lonely Cys domain-containing protein n=1 Tax=Streptomyces sp. NPDC088788 TaxID=3365898 RepID=UPI00382054BA
MLDAALGRVERAVAAWERVHARLDELGGPSFVPRTSRDAAERREVAQRVTFEDVPQALWAGELDPGLTVTRGELDAAGITLTAAVGESVMLGSLSLVDQVKVLMGRPGPWSPALDTVAANIARRSWRQARDTFGQGAPAGAGMTVSGAWSTAMGLVLPLELHHPESVFRNARESYRDAVQEVAALLMADGDHTKAVQLADRLRHQLGLTPRIRGGARTAHTPHLATIPENPHPNPNPDTPTTPPTPTSPLGTVSADTHLMVPAVPPTLAIQEPVQGDLPTSSYLDVGKRPERADLGTRKRKGDSPVGESRTGDGPPRQGKGISGSSLSAPASPLLPPLVAAYPNISTVPLPEPVPPRMAVPFVVGSEQFVDGGEAIGYFARQIARAGLRNHQLQVDLPDIEITAYGSDALHGAQGEDRRAAAQLSGVWRSQRVASELRHLLQVELFDLQGDLLAGERSLRAMDFRITSLGYAEVSQGSSDKVEPQNSELDRSGDPHAIIEVRTSPAAEAVALLSRMHRRDRRRDGDPLNLNDLSRQVLHLPQDADVTAAVREDFLALVSRARNAGRDGSFAGLAAFDLVERGILDPDRKQHFTIDGLRVPGLNWERADVIPLNTAVVGIGWAPESEMGGSPLPDSTSLVDPHNSARGLAPWGDDTSAPPYVIAAAGGPRYVDVKLPDGSKLEVTHEEFVELVAADPELYALPARSEIVLAIGRAGARLQDMPRLLAERTGRTVWAHSGVVQLSKATNGEFIIEIRHAWGKREGDWLASPPGMAWDPRDGDPFADFRHVLTYPIISKKTGLQIGRSSHSTDDMALGGLEEQGRHLDAITTFFHYNPVTREYSAERPMPGLGDESDAYHEDTHAGPSGQDLATSDGGSLVLSRTSLLRNWYRRKSIAGSWMSIGGCSVGAYEDDSVPRIAQHTSFIEKPFVADLLAQVPHGQRIANVVRMPVRAANRSQGIREINGQYFRTLNSDAWGRPGEWVFFLPEPEKSELDLLVDAVGWRGEEVQEWQRMRMLRAVRALRLTFGWDIERKEPRAGYLDLIRGFAALDDMWHVDGRFAGLGLFTLDMFERVVAERSDGGPDAEENAYRRVLSAAVSAGSGVTLAQFVSIPAIDHALAWRKAADFDAQTARALRMYEDEVTSSDRSRLFWARVKAEETLRAPGVDVPALAMKVLGYPLEFGSNFQHPPLWIAFTRAFAAGRDATDVAVVAAYVLEWNGALAGETRLTSQLGSRRGYGRNFVPGAKHSRINMAEITTFDGVQPAKWALSDDPEKKDLPCPYLVVVTPDANEPDRFRIEVAGENQWTSMDTLIELVAADRRLIERPANVEVVLGLTDFGQRSSGLAQRMADRLGRRVWWTSLSVQLSAAAGGGSLLALKDGLAGQPAPTADAWYMAKPQLSGFDIALRDSSSSDSATSEGLTPDRDTRGLDTPDDPLQPVVDAPDARDAHVGEAAARPVSSPSAGSEADTIGKTGQGYMSASAARGRDSGLIDEPAPVASAKPLHSGTKPVFAAPATASAADKKRISAPPATSGKTLVAFWGSSARLSRSGCAAIERLAYRVAWVAVTHRNVGVPLQEVDIVGHSAGLPGTGWWAERIGTARAKEVAGLFTRALDRELAARQVSLPKDQRPLVASDLTVRARYGGRGAVVGAATGAGRWRTVVNVSGPSTADAPQVLDTLAVRESERLGRNVMSGEEQARRVLHLDPDAEINASMRGALYTLVEHARAAGQADSMGELAAFHLRQYGVLERFWPTAEGRGRFTCGGEPIAGLNGGEASVVEFDSAKFDIVRSSAEDSILETVPQSAPWHGRVYPIDVLLRSGLVELRRLDGSKCELTVEEMAIVVQADMKAAGMGRSVPIVWPATPASGGDLALMERFAQLTERTVWVHSGRADFRGSSGKIRVVHQQGQREGDWLALDPRDRVARHVEGWSWPGEFSGVPTVDTQANRWIGSAFFPSMDLAGAREKFSRRLAQQTTYVHYNPATGEISDELPLPGPELMSSEYQAEHLYGHVRPGQVALPSDRYRLPGEDRIESWAGVLSRQTRARWISMASSWGGTASDLDAACRQTSRGVAGAARLVINPLRHLAEAQDCANGTRIRVRAPEHIHDIKQNRAAQYVHALHTDARGRRTRWRFFRPEPTPPELGRLARMAGLHTGPNPTPDSVRMRTLELLRALKITFGANVEDTSGFADLLRGVAALEQMWRGDPMLKAWGPFTLDALQRVVAAHPDGRQGSDQIGYRAVLAQAERFKADVPLTAFVSMTAVDQTVRWLRDAGASALIALAPDSSLAGEDLRSWMFWSRVKTYEALAGTDMPAVVRKVLHLGPDETVDAAREEELHNLLIRAFADGRAAMDPIGADLDLDVAAAYHLQLRGVWDRTTATTCHIGAETAPARDFTGRAAPAVVDLAVVEVDGEVQPAPWADANGEDGRRRVPSLFRCTLDHTDRGFCLLTLPDGTTHRAPHSEIPHLLAADPALQALDLDVDLLLDIPELDKYAPGLADDVAQFLGRGVWSTSAETGLTSTGHDASSVLTLQSAVADPGTRPAWTRRAPRVLAEPVYAPSSVPDPLPITAELPKSATATGIGTIVPVPDLLAATPDLAGKLGPVSASATRLEPDPPLPVESAPATSTLSGSAPELIAPHGGFETLPMLHAEQDLDASDGVGAGEPDEGSVQDRGSGEQVEAIPSREPDPGPEESTRSEAGSESDTSDTEAASDSLELSPFVSNFGRGHRGQQGSVHAMPLSDETLKWLHARIETAVRVRHQEDVGAAARELEAQDQGGNSALKRQVETAYAQDLIATFLPYILSVGGMVRIVTYRGRRYRVSCRLELSDARLAPTMAADVPEGRRVQIEEWNRTAVTASNTSARQTVRNLPLSYGRAWAMDTSDNSHLAALASLGLTPELLLRHNQESILTTAVKKYLALSALAFSAESSMLYDYLMTLQIRIDSLDGPVAAVPGAPDEMTPTEAQATGEASAPADATSPTSESDIWAGIPPVTAPGRLAAWFPDYLARMPEPRPFGTLFLSDEELPADPQILSKGFLPIRMDTIRDPAALHDEILASEELHPFLRRISPESADVLSDFLSEASQRSGLLLMLAGAYPSPVLQDRSGDTLGFLQVKARLQLLNPNVLASSKNLVMPTTLIYTAGVEHYSTVSNAASAGLSFKPAFANPNASGVGGGPTFSGAYQYQRDHSFQSGGTAYNWFGLVTENPQLLVEADIEFEAVFVSAEGGHSAPFTLMRPAGHLLRVPSKAEVKGVPVEAGQERHLTPEIVGLRTLGISVTPLEITGTEVQFQAIEDKVRSLGFLPPVDRAALSWMNGESRRRTLHAWAANQRELSLARSQVGLRCAARDMVGAGHSIYFDLPHQYETWRACVVVRMRPQASTYPKHSRNYPNWSALTGNGMSTASGESFTSSHSLNGEFAVEAHGPVSDHTMLQGAMPSSLSVSEQRSKTAGSSSGVGLDMLLYAQTGQSEFIVPVELSAKIFFGKDVSSVWETQPSNGNFVLTVPHARTLEERPDLLPAATIRPPTEDDYRLARMEPNENGERPAGAQFLPGYVHVSSAIGSTELIEMFQRLLGGHHENGLNAPIPGPLATILNWTTEQSGHLGGLLPNIVTQPAQWLKTLTFGQSLTYPENPAQEIGRAALSSTAILARLPQLARGAYSYNAGSAGSLKGTEVQGEVRGYMHSLQYMGVGTPPPKDFTGSGNWAESDVTATDSAWWGNSRKRTAQITFSGSGTGTNTFTGTGSGGAAFSTSSSESDADAVFTDRMNPEAREPLHAFRADFTYLLSLSRGSVNALANAVGIGPKAVQALAADVPGAIVFWMSDTDVRGDARLAELAGVTYTPPILDRLLPPAFVRSRGRALGPATVPDVVPDGPLDAFVETLRAEAERVAPGSLTPGSGAFVHGLDSRIAEDASVAGLRAMVGAGAEKWMRKITFVYRGWDGLRLVTLSVNARPAPHLDLKNVRGALRPKSGMENIYSSTPTTMTRTASRSGTFTLGLGGAKGFPVAVGQDNTASAGASGAFSSNGSRSTSQASAQHHDEWLRMYAPSAEAKVPYELQGTATSERLPDTLPGFLINKVVSLKQLAQMVPTAVLSANEILGLGRLASRLAGGVQLPGWVLQALGRTLKTTADQDVLPPPVTTGNAPPPRTLPPSGSTPPVTAPENPRYTAEHGGKTAESNAASATATSADEPSPDTPVVSIPVTVTLRFPASETPYQREDGTVNWSAPPALLTPQIHTGNPRETLQYPTPDTPAADPDPAMQPFPSPLADSALWTPQHTLVVGDFDAVDQLAQALRTVDPSLRDKSLPNNSESQEATMLRIGNLIGAGKVALTAAQASRFTGKRPSGSASCVQLTLYRPQTEASSRSTVLVDMPTHIRSTSSSGKQTYSTSVTMPLGGGLTQGNSDTLSVPVPVAGDNTTTGKTSGHFNYRRESLKYGTGLSQNEKDEPDESGVLGFTVTVHVVLEVSGPEDTRWVTGNAVVRATLEDVLGNGLTPVRASANVYDALSVLAESGLRDWQTLSAEDFGAQLADVFTEKDAGPQVWLDPGYVTTAARHALLSARTALLNDGTLQKAKEAAGAGLPETFSTLMDAAAHAASRALRPVTLVLRTPEGPVHLPFTPPGTELTVTDAVNPPKPDDPMPPMPPVPTVPLEPAERPESTVSGSPSGTARQPTEDSTTAHHPGASPLQWNLTLTPVPAPGPARTWEELRVLADEVIAQGPVAISGLGPCAGLVRRLTDNLFADRGVRPGTTRDDLAEGRNATEDALAPGRGWTSVSSWNTVTAALTASGPGSVAVVLASRHGDQPGHAWAAYALAPSDTQDDVAWVELMPRKGESPLSTTPPVAPPLDARAAVIASSGQVRVNALLDVIGFPASDQSTLGRSSASWQSLVDAPVNRAYAGSTSGSAADEPAFPASVPIPSAAAASPLSPSLRAGFGVELETSGATVGFYARAVVLLRGNGWRMETDTPDSPPYDYSHLEFVLDPVSDLEQLGRTLHNLVGHVARMRTAAQTDTLGRFRLSDVFGAHSADVKLEHDTTVSVSDPAFRANMQVTYGIDLHNLDATLADLLPRREVKNIQKLTVQIAKFFADTHGRPLLPGAREFVRLIIFYLERAGADRGAKGKEVQLHVPAAFRLMSRSDFCSIHDHLLTAPEREDVGLLLLAQAGGKLPDLMGVLGHNAEERVFHKPYDGHDNSLHHGPTKEAWLRSIVCGRGEGGFKKDLLSPPPGFLLHTGDMDVDFGMGAMGVDVENGLMLGEVRGAPYRPGKVPLNAMVIPIVAQEFARAIRINPKLKSSIEVPAELSPAAVKAGALSAMMDSLAEALAVAKRAHEQPTEFKRRLVTNYLANTQQDLDYLVVEKVPEPLRATAATLQEMAESLEHLRFIWESRGDPYAAFTSLDVLLVVLERELWRAQNLIGLGAVSGSPIVGVAPADGAGGS